MAVGSPLGELDLADKLRGDPAAILHFFARERPLRAFLFREIDERALGCFQRCEFFEYFAAQARYTDRLLRVEGVVGTAVGLGVNGQASKRVTAAYQDAQTQATLAVDAYERLAQLEPDDPNVQLELAQAAQLSGNTARAITAYEKVGFQRVGVLRRYELGADGTAPPEWFSFGPAVPLAPGQQRAVPFRIAVPTEDSAARTVYAAANVAL